MTEEELTKNIRQETRETKLRKKKDKIKQHGKGLARIYRNAIAKRGKLE